MRQRVSSRGGIGIRARLRILCLHGRTGSSPVDCIKSSVLMTELFSFFRKNYPFGIRNVCRIEDDVEIRVSPIHRFDNHGHTLATNPAGVGPFLLCENILSKAAQPLLENSTNSVWSFKHF